MTQESPHLGTEALSAAARSAARAMYRRRGAPWWMDAEDLEQDILLGLLRVRGLHSKRSVAWKSARLVLDAVDRIRVEGWLKNGRGTKFLALSFDETLTKRNSLSDLASLTLHDVTPDTEGHDLDVAIDIRRALARLPQWARDVAIHLAEGCSVAEAGKRAGLPAWKVSKGGLGDQVRNLLGRQLGGGYA